MMTLEMKTILARTDELNPRSRLRPRGQGSVVETRTGFLTMRLRREGGRGRIAPGQNPSGPGGREIDRLLQAASNQSSSCVVAWKQPMPPKPFCLYGFIAVICSCAGFKPKNRGSVLPAKSSVHRPRATLFNRTNRRLPAPIVRRQDESPLTFSQWRHRKFPMLNTCRRHSLG